MILMHIRLRFKVCLLSYRFILLKRVINIFPSQLTVIVSLNLLPLNSSPSLVTLLLSLLSFLDPLDPSFLIRHQLSHHATRLSSVLNCRLLQPQGSLRLLLFKLGDHPEVMLFQRIVSLSRLNLLSADELSLLLALLLLLKFQLSSHLLHRVADHSILNQTPVLAHFIIDILEFLIKF